MGEHIRRRRIQLGLSQPNLAKRLGVSTESVLNWEKHKKLPLVTQLGSIIDFLGYYPFAEPTSVSEHLLKKRRGNGWLIETAARHSGVDPSVWGTWERGEIILFRKHRTTVAELLGLDFQGLSDAMRARWSGKHRRWERLKLMPQETASLATR